MSGLRPEAPPLPGPGDQEARLIGEDLAVKVICRMAKESLVRPLAGGEARWVNSRRLTPTGVQRAAEAAVDRAAANHAALRAYRSGFDDTLRLSTGTGDAIELRRGDHPEPPSDTPWPP